ncbi:ATP-dependent DNA helicase [Trichonephila clavipes]|nr:ATP-dependent DNA helicase [Trichonephila clavipes]
MYVKVESERLRFIALNQTKLRAENYIHLQDAIRNVADLDPNSLGQMVILPSSFVNSARYLHEYTQDAFTYVRNYGRPDLFITMTCNPAWPEITRELIPGQNSTDKHDLTAREFKVKVQKFVALLTKAPEDGGHTLAQKPRGGIQEILVDNSWIVPYSPLLSKIFNCHINVEFCNTVKAIKYICKYINKGSDQAIFNIRQQDNVNIDPRDEMQTFRACRYVGSNEAAWRILGLPLHERHPTVIHLAVHLPNGERIYFTENNFRERMATPPKTTLTAFFQLCQNYAFAKTLPYVDVPLYYTWNVSLKEWKRRVQGTHVNGWPGVKAGEALGRIYTVQVSNFECYCLRILLNVIQGPTNFLDLETVDGQEFETFRQVCEKLELLEDDNHWDATMEEAVLCRSPSQIRELFAILICTYGLFNSLSTMG